MNIQDLDISKLTNQAIIAIKPEMKSLASEITSDRSLYELGIESIDVFEMAGFIEDALDIELPNDELSRIQTVGDVEKIIFNQLLPQKIELK